MQTITVVAVDDEQKSLDLMATMLEKIPNVKLIGAYTNPCIAKLHIVDKHLDIVSDFIGTVSIKVINITGQVIQASLIDKTTSILQMDLYIESSPPGLYLIMINHGSDHIIERVLLN